MNNQCLVTRLKSSIENSNDFDILGGFRATVNAGEGGAIQLSGFNDAPLHVYLPNNQFKENITNGYIIDSQNALMYNNCISYIKDVSNQSVDVVILNKYNISKLTVFSLNFIKLPSSTTGVYKFINDIREIQFINNNTATFNSEIDVEINLDDLYLPNIEWIEINYTGQYKNNYIITGDFTKLVTNAKPENLKCAQCLNNAFIPRITDFTEFLGKYINIEQMGFLTCNNLSGTVESFVAAQRANGRTTCDLIKLEQGGSLGNVTFNGSRLDYKQGGRIMSWTETTITIDDVTVTA